MSEGQRSNRNASVQAQELLSRMAKCRLGEITEYDPAQYAVKVMIQPEGIETGWIPVKMISGGDGWGAFIGPEQGAQAILEPVEGSRENFVMLGVLPSDDARPPDGGPPSGHVWLIDKSGTAMKFTNNGKVTLNGTLEVTGDVKAGGISLKTHIHGGVTSGGGTSGGPI